MGNNPNIRKIVLRFDNDQTDRLMDSDNHTLRLILGSMVYDLAMDTLETRMATWKEWKSVSRASEKAIPAPEGYGASEK